MNTHERFVKKVNKTDYCWNWTGSKSGSGYGQFWNGAKTIPAHWFLLDEHPKNGKEACHHCDNRLCVRPSHIFIGTRSDNMKDMVKKRRHNTSPGAFAMLKVRRICNGETNHQSVLSDSDAATIKAIGAGYGRGVAVAKKFGVSQTVVSGIWKGQRWSHIQPDATARQRAEAFLLTLGKWSATDKESLIVGATTEQSSAVQSTSSGGSGGASTYGGKGLGIAGGALPPETRITVNGKTFRLADIDKEMIE